MDIQALKRQFAAAADMARILHETGQGALAKRSELKALKALRALAGARVEGRFRS